MTIEKNLPVQSYILHERLFTCITLERVMGREPDIIRWAIRDAGYCMAKDGRWEYEPLPSSRTDAFLKRCRYNSVKDALEVWDRFKPKMRVQ